MESEVARANWERMTPDERLAVLPEIRQSSEPHAGLTYIEGSQVHQRPGVAMWEGMSDAEIANLPYDELPGSVQFDLWMAEDGKGFSGKAWDESYGQMTDGKELGASSGPGPGPVSIRLEDMPPGADPEGD